MLRAEAFLGDVVLAPGDARPLHEIVVDDDLDAGRDACTRLEDWADRAGRRGAARVAGPRRTGWCSWYHYFHDVTEADLRANLTRAADWPLDLIQLDDGFQQAIGDWLVTNPRFPSGVDGVAAGGHEGWMWVLDTTRPEVLAHLEAVASGLARRGFRHLKLDFVYAPALAGRFADPTRTPASRVRTGLEAIRRGAGDAVFLLGYGMPLAPAVGLVDGMRIGPDVAPWWALPPDRALVPGHGDCEPATRNAFRNTLVRAFMHRRLWVNDPDCVMLRRSHTDMSAAAARGWGLAAGISGGMLLLSDALGLLDATARGVFDEAVALGAASDAAASSGRTARCLDLLAHPTPQVLASAGRILVTDADTGATTLLARQ